MSFQAMTWAVAQPLPCTQKMVLLMLANCCNHQTGLCIPKVKTLAAECGLSVSGVKKSLKALEDGGLVVVEQRFKEGIQMANRYHLQCDLGGHQETGGGSPGNWGGVTRKPQGGHEVTTEPGREPRTEPGIKPREKSTRKRAPTFPKPDDIDEQVWTDWVALRTAKRAGISPTVISQARAEAEKAGLEVNAFFAIWVARGSQGLSADWIKPNERASPQSRQKTFREIDDEAHAARIYALTGGIMGKQAAASGVDIFDMEAFDEPAAPKKLGR